MFTFTFGNYVKNLTDDQVNEKAAIALDKKQVQPQQDRDDEAEAETGIFDTPLERPQTNHGLPQREQMSQVSADILSIIRLS